MGLAGFLVGKGACRGHLVAVVIVRPSVPGCSWLGRVWRQPLSSCFWNMSGWPFGSAEASAWATWRCLLSLRHVVLGLMSPTWQQVIALPLLQVALSGKCSALVKLAPDLSDIWLGHSTWDTYTAALRIFKHYNFKLRGLQPAGES